MLLWLFEHLATFDKNLLVFKYLTLRAMLGVLTALGFSMALGPRVIERLRALKFGQAVRTDGPQSHLVKQGTPTMGGVLILLSIAFATLLWCDLSNPYVWIVLGVMVVFGAVGWADDWLKIKHKNPKGLSAGKKYFWTSVGALGAGIALYLISRQTESSNPQQARDMLDLLIPLFKDLTIPLSALPLGLGFIAFTYFVINGASNAVNMTDGLDGLAIMPVVMVAAGLGAFAYLSGDARYAAYLYLPYIPQTSELVVICGAMVGSGLGFLWFNAHPAQVFMGDVGALTLGAMLGTIAVMVRQELVFAIMGGIFVMGRYQSCCRWVRTSCARSGFFAWPRSITILRKRAGRKRRLRCGSGLSPSCWC